MILDGGLGIDCGFYFVRIVSNSICHVVERPMIEDKNMTITKATAKHPRLFNGKIFGERLRLDMMYDKISVRELAKQLGISPATLQRIRSGYEPSIEPYLRVRKWLEGND